MSRANTMAPSYAGTSDGAPPPGAPAVPQVPLVGAVGQDYVHTVLSSTDPQSALKEIQKRGAFKNRRCEPLLRLLDQLGLKRSDTTQRVLEAAKRRLLDAVPKLSPAQLISLLEASFAYVGLPQLREVPLAVLGRLKPVPAAFLKQLATDKELFHELPQNVQQEVWELDRKLLQQHALPLVERYTWETGTVLKALEMDSFVPPAPNSKDRPGPLVPRRIQRSGSPTLKKLVAMVGKSHAIYKGIMDLCAVRLRDSESAYCGVKEAAYCCLRSQLLMALHDANIIELTSKEPVHKLAWTLDACLKDRVIDERRLRELNHFLSTFDRQQAQLAAAARKALPKKRGREGVMDAESMGLPGRSTNAGAEPMRALADAGMVLRDPSTMYLIIHHVLRRLEVLVENQQVPSEDSDLAFLTRLLQLAVGCRSMLRYRKYSFPAADPDLLGTFYPELISCMLDMQDVDDDYVDDDSTKALPNLVGMLARNEVVRQVTEVLCLERVVVGDVVTARSLLATIIQALEKLSDNALVEFAPFAATLAQRLARLVSSARLAPGQPLWTLAVDSFLLRACDTEGQVHEEVLRLLLAALPKLNTAQLAHYLQETLKHSRKSRKRTKRRHAEAEGLDEAVAMAGYETAGFSGYHSSAPSDYYGGFSDGRLLDRRDRPKKGGDEVKYLYKEFVKHCPGLNADNAPHLFEYLAPGAAADAEAAA
ncbi:Negative elongation factor B [Coccomyxa sp. Obi]|nr:Negative elongation factor B [Coccomyxa sp. Obi]